MGLRWLLAVSAIAAAASLCGCRSSAGAVSTVEVQAGPVLGDALTDLSEAYMAVHPRARILPQASCPLCLLSVDATSEAPFDVVVSMGRGDINRFAAAGLIDASTIGEVGRTGLSIVVSPDSRLQIGSIEDLASPEVKRVHLADPDTASLGVAARQALSNAGILAQVEPKMVDCRTGCEVLKTVALQEAEVGFVYSFCAEGGGRGQVQMAARVPKDLYQPVPILIALSTSASSDPEARGFRDYILSPAGRDILRTHGITFPGQAP